MHLAVISVFFLAIFGPTNCKETLYPWPFLTLMYAIVVHQLYDFFLYSRNYLVKVEKLPAPDITNMRYNKDLFEKQTKCLLIINVLFGLISILVVVFSYCYIASKDGIHVLCIGGFEWQALDFVGTLFIGAHQLLIMMQVKMSQYVLVKIPERLNLFQPVKSQQTFIRLNVREKLLVGLKESGNTEGADELQKKFATADKQKKNDLFRI